MKLYEHVFLLRQDISSQQIKDTIGQYQSLIQENGGEVRLVNELGMRTIAYRIRKNRKAYYVFMNIASPPAAIHEMKRKMRIDENVLRSLTLLVDSHEQSPTLTIQRHDRDDRNDRFPRDRNVDRKQHVSEEKPLS
ncbi:30S ribosomal protein S6 [Candidatus Liberibacter asiaticus]|uniref:Small ribosomal subunit protein bS6 n=2 Tax=Liberibacter asiaticus TaxID=34021 RepID=C6XHQ9_LIBAP|nr:30S ribosomal protein S6 [Candidatus Liberibacter asiaticus]ACT56802.1 30S ribosomal protein S6 [Candidatus Liberibacter asiaticus str. psy62]AGH16569.1 30S ribosomal protein S6 [Candidatus Liberibacter asiaticus str. gxpsy]ALK06960.1 30S ribosomal protein S6 [Candidatus Liberibacter asiaticus]ASK52430.1 30S ribosomal protein S6 [Candidatus Liberibacter asiaticus]AWL13757.1 30S ribosomal protein S6 [Candidatus Liberibacter asiaticus]